MQVRPSAHRQWADLIVSALDAISAIGLLGRHTLAVLLVALGVMFLVSLAAFLLYMFILPSDPGGKH